MIINSIDTKRIKREKIVVSFILFNIYGAIVEMRMIPMIL